MAQRNPSAVEIPFGGLVVLGAAALAVGAGVPGILYTGNPTWSMTRAVGLVAFGLLWLSTVLGLLQSTGYFRSGSSVLDLHTFVSIWALYTTVFHVVVLLFDRHSPFTLTEILVPFAAASHPVLNGIGALAFYIALGVTVTTYFRVQIGAKAWRTIHLTSLAAFFFALIHGVMIGTDSQVPLIAYMYRFAAVSVAALLGYRIYLGVKKRADTAGGR